MLHLLPNFIHKAILKCHLVTPLKYNQVSSEDYKNISGWEITAKDEMNGCNYRIIIQPLVALKEKPLMYSDFETGA